MWPCAEQALKAGCASGPQRRGLHFLRDWGSGHRDGDQDSCLNPTITTSQAGSHQDAAPTSCQSLQQPLRVCVCVCVRARARAPACVWRERWGTDSSGTFSVFQVLDKCCVRAKSLQSCPTLYDPVDCSPPGSSVHGILQARILEWVAMPSSRGSS